MTGNALPIFLWAVHYRKCIDDWASKETASIQLPVSFPLYRGTSGFSLKAAHNGIDVLIGERSRVFSEWFSQASTSMMKSIKRARILVSDVFPIVKADFQ